ncbi:hypothetical protein M422DRAFT_247436 [Sphaerobolus stellatus SS14]|nr:hypothetical protein M422DRAFT_247436 [Sphaerobolus stellatus SS14]
MLPSTAKPLTKNLGLFFSSTPLPYPLDTPPSPNHSTPCPTSSPLSGSTSFSAVSTAGEWVISRLMMKLAKLKNPSFLKSVVVRSSNSSHHTAKPASASISPTTLHPAAKCTDADAEKKEDKPYEVSLVGGGREEVEGQYDCEDQETLFNRLWYTFTTLSQTEVSIEPVASDLQIRWGMVPLRHLIPTQGDSRSGVFIDAFACPSTMTTTVTTPEKSTVIKDEVSVKMDESLHLPGLFGRTLNNGEMDDVQSDA